MAVKRKISESLELAIFLCLAGGFQDAYSYNCRNGVFANAQTGNIVLLGQNLATGNLVQALHYLFPILAFIGGVYSAEWIQHLCKNKKVLNWRQIILLTEIFFLIIVGMLPQNFNILANVLMSFACAMQVNSFRKFCGVSCATTMCIGNLRSATECLSRYHITKDQECKRKSYLYYFIILIFAVGASIGALCSQYFGEHAIWGAAFLLVIGFILMFAEEGGIRTEVS